MNDINLCYHWCVAGRHDWAHQLRGAQERYAYPDQYKCNCPEHKSKDVVPGRRIHPAKA
jgi:hypothetical protein